jgi:hypothetical protein
VEPVVLNEENDKAEDRPLKAKKEVYRQQEVSSISSPSSLFYVLMVILLLLRMFVYLFRYNSVVISFSVCE